MLAWLSVNWGSLLVGAVLLVLVALCIRAVYRDAKGGCASCGAGCGCSGSCSGCSGCGGSAQGT